MKKPFVSVVVASYNRKYIINESIQSILSQNYPENSFEVIVVDNNSNDGTVSEIGVSEGVSVGAGDVVIVITPDS